MRLKASAPWFALAFAVAGCGTRPVAKNDGHLAPEPRASATIPQPLRSVPMPPPPEAREAEIRYSVVVANQPVRDVLLAMARETRVNFDIHPGIDGTINLNAIDQTLKQILTRIAKQVDVRWETDGNTITVMPDTPYLRNYRVDYVNMARDVSGTIGVQSQVVSPPSASGGSASANASQNSSLLKVDNVAKNRFWETLEKNLKDMLRETDKVLPEGSSETFVQSRGQGQTQTTQQRSTPRRSGTASQSSSTVTTPGAEQNTQAQEFVEQRLTFREAASVIVNAESGLVTVRATSRQHEKVSEFLASVMSSARRQILIEATVVEVQLSDRYQSGVDWSALGLNGLGYSITQSFVSGTGTLANAALPFFSVQYTNPNAAIGGSISSTIKLLDQFGNTRVLSSPRIMAINNQTAVLKVVDNLVYFTVDVTPATLGTAGNVLSPATIKTTPQLVPVGFVMNVTPQVSDSDVVVLNVRPTVTSKIGEVRDPNPELARVNQSNLVPVIRSREFESVLRIPSGSTAILGGLMEDRFDGKRGGLPVLSRIPLFGDLVSFRDDTSEKRELVIFLRPVVVRDASLEGDLAEYRRYVPGDKFFRESRPFGRQFDETVERMERGEFPRGTPVPVVPDNYGGRN
ncbi:MAG TPA: secretin N-terminal domain-containing protein [Usitatibacter sp.]|nr:secretin N-terminal domain-containing protein [Usitatibacter sp.]